MISPSRVSTKDPFFWIPYQPEMPTLTFKDIGGYDDIKTELRYILRLLNPESAEPDKAFDCRLPRGVLLIGPPGTGKTYLAKAVAGEAGIPLFVISASELIEIFVGVGAHRVRSLFVAAKKHMPSVIFIDEIDSIGRIRGGTTVFDASEREQTLNALLSELDGFDQLENVLVIAATNRFEILDTALRRPGRFDYIFRLGYPNHNDRENIFQALLRTVSCDHDITSEFLVTLADACFGASQADLAFIVRRAVQLTIRRDATTLRATDLQQASMEWKTSRVQLESLDAFLLESRMALSKGAVRPRARITLHSGEVIEGYAQWQDSQYLKILTPERPSGLILRQFAVASLEFVPHWDPAADTI